MGKGKVEKFLDVLKGAAVGVIPGFMVGGPIGAAGGALAGGSLSYLGADHTESDRRDLMAAAKELDGYSKLSAIDKKTKKRILGLVKKYPYLSNPESITKIASGDLSALQQAIPDRSPGSSGSGNTQTFNKYTPDQQAAMGSFLKKGMSGLDQFQPNFGDIESAARKGFSEQTIPGIAERFTKMGAQKSNAFGQQLGAAGADLESNLGLMRQQFGNENRNFFGSLSKMGLEPQIETLYTPGNESFGQKLLGNLISPDMLKAGIGLAAKHYGF